MTTIYKFSFGDESYIGSTNGPLINRIKEHGICVGRDRCKHIALYKYMFDNDIRKKLPDCFEVLEKCDTKLERTERTKLEQEYMNIHKPKLNMRNAYGRKRDKKKDK